MQRPVSLKTRDRYFHKGIAHLPRARARSLTHPVIFHGSHLGPEDLENPEIHNIWPNPTTALIYCDFMSV